MDRNALRANFVDAAEEWYMGTAVIRRLPKAKWLQMPEEVKELAVVGERQITKEEA